MASSSHERTTNPFSNEYAGSTNPFSTEYQGDRPPPFNPDFIRSVEKGATKDTIKDATKDAIKAANKDYIKDANKGRQIKIDNPSTPMTIDPDKIEHVTFDEATTAAVATETHTSQQAPSPFNPDFLHNVSCSDGAPISPTASVAASQPSLTSSRSWSSWLSSRTLPTGPSSSPHITQSSNTETLPPRRRSSSSLKLAWIQIKRASIKSARKMKKYEEDHEIRTRTKRAAIQSCRAVKTATVQAGQKAKELNEKHQVTTKTKQQFQRGASFVKKKCSPSSVRQQ